MIQIDIHIPRPFLTLSIVAAVGGFMWMNPTVISDAMGGSDQAAYVVQDAEQDIQRLREEQEVLSRREQILRTDLEALEMALSTSNSDALSLQLLDTRDRLLELLQDKQAAEQEILVSLHEIWEAQGVAIAVSRTTGGTEVPYFDWPVEPTLGISAHFQDDSYFKRFGMQHQAVDIPVIQGSMVYAAADGIIEKVSDNGKGYSSLIIVHSGGYATLYGHVSGFLVKEGQKVYAGDPVALSGGIPGTSGAGRMTTGAHLHFELILDGTHVDPLPYLPEYSL